LLMDPLTHRSIESDFRCLERRQFDRNASSLGW
jgi:hypothetical protein